MEFNAHFKLEGKHAFLGASNHHWLNYTSEKLATVFRNSMAAARGTALHELASKAITLGIRLAESEGTLAKYVNDAIDMSMLTEQILYYSDNCFGTADTISFAQDVLSIHDLKTGLIKASKHQLEIYVALFCLEYQIKPGEITIKLRIYQNDDIVEWSPEPDLIQWIMDKIVDFDIQLDMIKEAECNA